MQPVILCTNLLKLQITSTLAACLVTMDVFKVIGYVSVGFIFADYIPHIVLANISGLVGTWAGKHVIHKLSEQTFRLVFKSLITLLALRLLYRGLMIL